jgi:hypothetical protein
VHIIGLTWLSPNPKAHLPRQSVALAIITGRTASYNILPAIVPTAGQGVNVISSQKLPALEVRLASSTVLTRIAITGKEKHVRDLPLKSLWDMNIANEADHCRTRDHLPLGAKVLTRVLLKDFSFAIQD